jgi:hypothetical protein
MIKSVPEPLPLEVGQLGNFEARMVRTFHAAVDDWDEVCSALGAWESKHLTVQDAENAKKQHHQWLTNLLAWGRMVQMATAQPEFPDKVLAQRVSARIRHLEDKLSLWHREMTSSEEDRILQAAFK